MCIRDSNTIEQVEALIPYAGGLYVGLGNSAGEGEVWELKNGTWTKVGGDDLNGSWADGTYERVRSFTVYNGDIYAGLGSTAGEGEVWRYRLGTWTKVGGNSLNASWANAMEEVESLSVYRGKLYAGTGNSANVDATVWSYGDNAYVQSTTASFGTNWHHLAGTYDGITQRIYINGVLEASNAKAVTVPTEDRPLLIGAGYAGREQGKPQSRAEGLLDEVRLSSVARTSFTTSPYSAAHETISPTTSVRQGGLDGRRVQAGFRQQTAGVFTVRGNRAHRGLDVGEGPGGQQRPHGSVLDLDLPPAVARAELLEQVWALPGDLDTRATDMAISQLRKKLEADPKQPAIIVSVKGAGYRWGAG